MTLNNIKKNSEDEDYQTWWNRQRELKENMRRVCKKYGQNVESIEVDMSRLIYDPDHKLLFCRNAKVEIGDLLNIL